MVIERLVFRAKFGQGDQVAEAFRTWQKQFAARFGQTTRVLVDLSGVMFTVVVESEYRDMAHVNEIADQLASLFGDTEFQQWFASWQGAVESGSRELYRVLA
jgi:hypothetical protein